MSYTHYTLYIASESVLHQHSVLFQVDTIAYSVTPDPDMLPMLLDKTRDSMWSRKHHGAERNGL